MLRRTRFNPKPGALDFWNEFRKPTPYRIPILIVSCIPILLIFAWAMEGGGMIPPKRPKVDYITTFASDRTDAEIIASNVANQNVQDERAARRAELIERKKEVYRTIGRATGVDVDRMENDIADRDIAEKDSADQLSEQPTTNPTASPSAKATETTPANEQ